MNFELTSYASLMKLTLIGQLLDINDSFNARNMNFFSSNPML